MSPVHHSSGIHLIADLHGIAPDMLTDPAALEHLLRQSALAAGASIIYSHFHTFGTGQGVTGVVLLAESHITIHTWPECGFAAADIFMCGAAQPERALEVIVSALHPASSGIRTIERGDNGKDKRFAA
ncbi:MAG TPA: adenosylmethionine decarboxylase [Noviherbaspirillum sp.]|jgi:S-adenosylmethionine decarboxylase|uniref:adenosylmethionine decarboxylase n=1 Tax=Noviherbaspirillum sp. TaxID=1926288 RepID=UPI002DDD2275|nr:adenosylmethionine decarboxylase [Noviherbaspirillum sp.]HEV2609246.1 adenosylmethionine decarboxylase [Noviherbaspirillum sp.]